MNYSKLKYCCFQVSLNTKQGLPILAVNYHMDLKAFDLVMLNDDVKVRHVFNAMFLKLEQIKHIHAQDPIFTRFSQVLKVFVSLMFNR